MDFLKQKNIKTTREFLKRNSTKEMENREGFTLVGLMGGNLRVKDTPTNCLTHGESMVGSGGGPGKAGTARPD